MKTKELQKVAYELAVLIVQSDLYHKDIEITKLVDELLSSANFRHFKINIESESTS